MPWPSVPAPVLPDIESALLYALVPLEPDIRFVTIMPGGDLAQMTARIHRISGANRNIHVDRPIVDIDVYGPKSEAGTVSAAARSIQADIHSFAGIKVMNGVIQHANTIAGPRQLPEANPDIVRYSATYEILIHP
jgi:hypothetical protein